MALNTIYRLINFSCNLNHSPELQTHVSNQNSSSSFACLINISRLRCQKSYFWFPDKTCFSYRLPHSSSCLKAKTLEGALTCFLPYLISKPSGNLLSYIFKINPASQYFPQYHSFPPLPLWATLSPGCLQ